MIHATAIVHPTARLGKNVSVGPYSIIEEHVSIGDDTAVGPHVVINGHTTIGKNNRFYQFSSIGEANQDKKYAGEPTETRIGNDNIFRECCTIHRGTPHDKACTTIGNDNLIMAYTHVAHDCVVGSHNIMANNATLAGHVEIGDWVTMAGFSGVHQFCRIGSYAMTGIHSTVTQDIPPYVMYANNAPRFINAVGLNRRGFTDEEITILKRAYKIIYRQGLRIEDALKRLDELKETCSRVQPLIDFIRQSDRGLAR